MLSEEEKKAIEKLEEIREQTIRANECGLSNNDFKEEIEVYNTVLNLITKLQKENKEKDRYIKNKDKQIDLMADYIGKEDITEIFCDGKIGCDENCKTCVKQYFERQVNSSKQ